MAFHPPRGISPELLISQVKNTAPYLFTEAPLPNDLQNLEPVAFLRAWRARAEPDLTHLEYFKLCLSSHLLSCATPVPTDVDLQIRSKLWHEKLPLETTLEMADLVIRSRHWDFCGISKRFLNGALSTSESRSLLSGHQGEWFTVATGAYGALGRSLDPAAIRKREEIFSQIEEVVHCHSEIFGSHWSAQDGIECLKASALIAHNMGDLDRVMDLWEISSVDPLRLQFYKLTAEPLDTHRKLRYRGRLWVAGELYKAEIAGSAMAFENHRHFALRKPRALRRSPNLLVPLGPFFDHWGKTVATELGETEDLQETLEALIHGWSRLPKTVGYGRALCGIFEMRAELRDQIPELKDLLKNKKIRKLMEASQESFEALWNAEALHQMEEIPGRL